MNWYNHRLPLAVFTLTLSLTLIIAPRIVAQTNQLESNSPNVTITPPGDNTPVNTVGAGTRNGGSCPQDQITEESLGFQVLMPPYSETTEERPNFSLQVPNTVAKKVFLSLRDVTEDYYYQTTIFLPTNPGQFNFSLPADAPVIETNKEYTWFLSLICNQDVEPNDPTLGGVIKRVEPDAASELHQN